MTLTIKETLQELVEQLDYGTDKRVLIRVGDKFYEVDGVMAYGRPTSVVIQAGAEIGGK